MIKKMWCFIWGHRIREKAMTGNTMTVINLAGMETTVSLYVWNYNDICPRCGKKLT